MVVALVVGLVAGLSVHAAAPARAATAPPVRTYTYVVRGLGNGTDLEAFATGAATTLADGRGWSLGGSIAFTRVAQGGDFTLWLSAAGSVPSFGAPCDSTYSCSVGRNVIINETRWHEATPSWTGAGAALADYRRMVVNHEVGHWLGFGHASCGGAGQLAPVMQQQSISLQSCRPNPWPTDAERSTVGSWTGVPVRPAAPGALPSWGPVAVNADGRFETFAVTLGGALVNAFQHEVGHGWSDWYPHPGSWPTDRRIATTRSADGHLAVLAVDGDGRVLLSRQRAIGLGWTDPTVIGAGAASAPVAARNHDGSLVVFVVGTDGQLRATAEDGPGGAFGAWTVLAGAVAGPPAVAVTPDGRLAVVVVGADGRLRIAAQTTPGGSWTPYVVFAAAGSDSGLVGTPAIGRNLDGRLEVVGRTAGGALRHAWQEGFGWSALVAFAGVAAQGDPVVAAQADGRLEILVEGGSGTLTHLWQEWAGGRWTDAQGLGGVQIAGGATPAVQANGDGRLEVFVLGTDHQLWHTFQLAPNWAWSPEYPLGGALASA